MEILSIHQKFFQYTKIPYDGKITKINNDNDDK